MKKFVLVIALAALSLSSFAFAQDPLVWEDNIAIFFAEDGGNNCDVAGPGLLTTYLVLTNCTSNSVGGWEAKPEFEGGATLVTLQPRGTFFNAATRVGEYIIGLASPLMPVAGHVVLSDVLVIVDDAAPGYGFVKPAYFHSLPLNVPAYIDGEDPALIKRLLPYSGQVFDAQIVINGACGPVDNEDASFGAVKALFR